MSESAADNLGGHLLGRVPSPPDSRDFQLKDFIGASPLDIALAQLQASKSVALATKNWAKVITDYLQNVTPAPPPPAPPPTTNQLWADPEGVLDQGQTGHCVGFGWADFGNTDPIEDNFANKDGDALYYECKIIDGEPGQENGSSVRSGAKAMLNRKRIGAYAFAKTVDEIKQWVDTKGPVVVGTDWMQDMFNPDANGYIKPTGKVAGGHCFLLLGDLKDEGAFSFLNSWGNSWGLAGYFKMKYADFDVLLQANGEACAAIELAV